MVLPDNNHHSKIYLADWGEGRVDRRKISSSIYSYTEMYIKIYKLCSCNIYLPHSYGEAGEQRVSQKSEILSHALPPPPNGAERPLFPFPSSFSPRLPLFYRLYAPVSISEWRASIFRADSSTLSRWRNI